MTSTAPPYQLPCLPCPAPYGYGGVLCTIWGALCVHVASSTMQRTINDSATYQPGTWLARRAPRHQPGSRQT